jgi:hypothetical protein
MRSVLVSLTVNSTYPSPERRDVVEDAPAFHPAAAVLVRLVPETLTPTAFVHTTFWAGGALIVPVPCALAMVAPAGVLKLTKNVLAARRVALMTWTGIVCVVVPGVKERFPAVAT